MLGRILFFIVGGLGAISFTHSAVTAFQAGHYWSLAGYSFMGLG